MMVDSLQCVHPPFVLALNWGKHEVVAYLLAENGAVLVQRSENIGSMYVQGQAIVQALHKLCGDWLAAYPTLPIIACGMIGSREGLQPTLHLTTPFNPQNLLNRLVRIDELLHRPAAIVPGVCDNRVGSLADVSRGMETCILGLLCSGAAQDGVYLLPGTHSVWVKLREGMVEAFRSYMTGELLVILSQHSVLGLLSKTEHDYSQAGLLRGLTGQHVEASSLANKLFSVRALGLSGEIAAADLQGYLAGILIAEEIEDGRRWARAEHLNLIPSGCLSDLYATALSTLGQAYQTCSDDCLIKGLHFLARQTDWSAQ